MTESGKTTEDLVNEGAEDDGLPVYGDDLEDIEPYEEATPAEEPEGEK